MTKRGSSALVVFSGGQDSTTCLAWALGEFKEVNAISFNYRQRHGVELESAKKIISLLNQGEMQLEGVSWKGKIGHEIIDVGFLSDTLQTAMIQESEITHDEETGLPTTFVPGRNIFFLSIAAAVAYQRKVKHLVTGVCQTDYSDYPDCRDATIKSLQATLRLGLDYDVILHTPLMWKTKGDTVKMMKELGGLELYKYTHTCYKGERPACGECFSCELRLKGFKEAGIKDPLEYREK